MKTLRNTLVIVVGLSLISFNGLQGTNSVVNGFMDSMKRLNNGIEQAVGLLRGIQNDKKGAQAIDTLKKLRDNLNQSAQELRVVQAERNRLEGVDKVSIIAEKLLAHAEVVEEKINDKVIVCEQEKNASSYWSFGSKLTSLKNSVSNMSWKKKAAIGLAATAVVGTLCYYASNPADAVTDVVQVVSQPMSHVTSNMFNELCEFGVQKAPQVATKVAEKGFNAGGFVAMTVPSALAVILSLYA